MRTKRGQIFNVLFLVLVIGLTFYGVFQGQDLDTLLGQLSRANPLWLVAGVVCIILFIYGESFI
ncbi:MAG: UPF0104 family protein, partial [Lachnospiraceae bacterium]